MTSKPISWTFTRAAAEFNIARETLRKGLLAQGLSCERGVTYTTSQVCKAVFTDGKTAKARETNARADLLEIKRKELERDLIRLEEAEQFMAKVWTPIRQAFVALPSLAPQVNPTDPEHAKKHLETYRDQCLRMCREVRLADEPVTVSKQETELEDDT